MTDRRSDRQLREEVRDIRGLKPDNMIFGPDGNFQFEYQIHSSRYSGITIEDPRKFYEKRYIVLFTKVDILILCLELEHFKGQDSCI
jgi:hypothetical protein